MKGSHIKARVKPEGFWGLGFWGLGVSGLWDWSLGFVGFDGFGQFRVCKASVNCRGFARILQRFYTFYPEYTEA